MYLKHFLRYIVPVILSYQQSLLFSTLQTSVSYLWPPSWIRMLHHYQVEILRAEKKKYYCLMSPFKRDKLFLNTFHPRRPYCFLLLRSVSHCTMCPFTSQQPSRICRSYILWNPESSLLEYFLKRKIPHFQKLKKETQNLAIFYMHTLVLVKIVCSL